MPDKKRLSKRCRNEGRHVLLKVIALDSDPIYSGLVTNETTEIYCLNLYFLIICDHWVQSGSLKNPYILMLFYWLKPAGSAKKTCGAFRVCVCFHRSLGLFLLESVFTTAVVRPAVKQAAKQLPVLHCNLFYNFLSFVNIESFL